MQINVVAQGKFPGTFKVETPEGPRFVKPSSKCTTGLEVGKSYEANLFQPEGKKTTYVTKAELLDGAPVVASAPSTVETVNHIEENPTIPEPKKTPETTSVIPDKMSKEDWAKKDSDRADGQARGNYRMCLTRFIISKQGDVKDEDIEVFNEQLKLGEDDYFGQVLLEPQDVSKESAPVVAGNVADPYRGL